MATCREASKGNWASNGTTEDINQGSLQRIADATEKMAQGYIQLINDRDWWKRRSEGQEQEITRLNNRIKALKGVITKMKNSKK